MKVPFLDLQSLHAPRRTEILAAIGEVIDSGELAGGIHVENFERAFAAYCGTRHAVAVGTGTEALWLALAGCGIGPGDEVITVPMTFFATVEAILMTGATPVFVDVDEKTRTMDVSALEDALTARTKAILPVHLFGQPADMDPINAFARKHDLLVIEDAAQAHGAEYRGRKAGSLGTAGCFSFYPSKNLGALGEGGAVTTDDDTLASCLRAMRNHGQTVKNLHVLPGSNCRMDGIQGAVLSLKLSGLDEENLSRRAHAACYRQALAGLENVIVPEEAVGSRHVYHLFTVAVDRRTELISALDLAGIGHGIHYPVPAHLQPACGAMGHTRGDFPVSESLAGRLLSLPMFPTMRAEQIDAVADAIRHASRLRAVA